MFMFQFFIIIKHARHRFAPWQAKNNNTHTTQPYNKLAPPRLPQT